MPNLLALTSIFIVSFLEGLCKLVDGGHEFVRLELVLSVKLRYLFVHAQGFFLILLEDLHVIIRRVVELLELGPARVVFGVALVVGPVHLLVDELDLLLELANLLHQVLRHLRGLR